MVKEDAAQERDDSDLVVETLAPGAKKSTSASTRLSRGSRRGLIWPLIGGVALFAVILTGMFVRSRFLATPTPTPGPENALIVTSNFNSGTVTMNGKKLTGTFPLLVRLNAGDNTITYSAPPFRDRTCHVTLLDQLDPKSGQRVEAVGDGCGTGNQEPAITFQGVTVSNAYLFFGMTGADLPNDLRNAAENALWPKLTNLPSFQVPAGDYYATGTTTTGRITSARAAVPLLATLALTHDNATQVGPACSVLGCGGQPLLPEQNCPTVPVGTWLVQESVAVGWRSMTQSGALVATFAFRDGGAVMVGLTYSSTTGWSVVEDAPGTSSADLRGQLISGTCQGGFIVLQTLIAPSSLAAQQLSFSSGSPSGLTAPQTDGCWIRVEGNNNNPLAPNGAKQHGSYIWRWGVLLAADAQARTLFPSLPVAPQSEITAVGGVA